MYSNEENLHKHLIHPEIAIAICPLFFLKSKIVYMKLGNLFI